MKSLHNLINKTARSAMQQDSQMKQVISRIVPATSMAHINFCRLEAGRLRITVDNATWIAKLRFSERQIVGALREAKLDVVTLSFHVVPAETRVTYTPKPTPNRSSNAAALALLRLAESTALIEQEAGAQKRRSSSTTDDAETGSAKENGMDAVQPELPTTTSVVRRPDDSLRQELLKLAAKLKEEP